MSKLTQPQDTEDKIAEMTPSMLMAASGETCDRDRFLSYIKRNLEWYYFKNGHELTIDAAASYTRDELAHALRRVIRRRNVQRL